MYINSSRVADTSSRLGWPIQAAQAGSLSEAFLTRLAQAGLLLAQQIDHGSQPLETFGGIDEHFSLAFTSSFNKLFALHGCVPVSTFLALALLATITAVQFSLVFHYSYFKKLFASLISCLVSSWPNPSRYYNNSRQL